MRELLLALVAGTSNVAMLASSPVMAQLSINVSVTFAPPALPVYDQPPIPGPDYIWVPGYWAWDDDVQDYFWIPGTWMLAPRPGLLWTPPWWGWQGGTYLFHPGYWGPHVGFYGGIAYGFGYTGTGFQGAYWNGPHVFYNRSVTNITNVHVTNVYEKTVVVNRITNVSYNGGQGGVQARPSADEQAALHEAHVAPTPVQQQHFEAARANRQLFASANRGRPPIAAAARPAQLNGPGVVPTRQAPPYHPQQGRSAGGGGPPQPAGAPHDPAHPQIRDGGQPAPADLGRPGQAAGRTRQQAPSDLADRPDSRPPSNPDRRYDDQHRPVGEPHTDRAQMRDEGPPARPAVESQAPPPAAPRHAPPPPHPRPANSGHPHPRNAGHPKPPPPRRDDHHHG